MNEALVRKYLRGNCTQAEARKVQQWLKMEEGQQFLSDEMDNDLRAIDSFGDQFSYPEINSDAIFAQIQDTKKNRAKHNYKRIDRSRYTIQKWVGIAAAIVLMLFVSLFLLEQEKPQRSNPETTVSARKVISPTKADTLLTLADGSTVRLEANSELIIHKNFDKELRTVQLTGKAYFNVRNISDRPFVVQTNYSFIRVVGTKFEVEAYPGQPEVIVKVDEGKVRFFAKDERVEPIDLVKNESGVLRFRSAGDSLNTTGNKPAMGNTKPLLVRYRSVEKDPKIKFVDNRLFVALGFLERTYNVDIELEQDSLKYERFTLTTDHSLLGALERIADSLGLSIEYQRKENKLYLHEK